MYLAITHHRRRLPTPRGEDEIQVDRDTLWCDAVALAAHAVALQHREALALHRGELLDGLYPEGVPPKFQEWLDERRRVLRELAAGAAWSCSRADEEAVARRALELTPDDEEGVRRLMSLLDRHGDRAGAPLIGRRRAGDAASIPFKPRPGSPGRGFAFRARPRTAG